MRMILGNRKKYQRQDGKLTNPNVVINLLHDFVDSVDTTDMRIAMRDLIIKALVYDDEDLYTTMECHCIFWDEVDRGVNPEVSFNEHLSDDDPEQIAVALREGLVYMLKELDSLSYYRNAVNQYIGFWDDLYAIECDKTLT